MVVECLEKLQVLKLQLGQMRETVKETRGSLLAETLKVSGGIPTLDMTRSVFSFLRGFESHRCSKNIITEAEFELSDEES